MEIFLIPFILQKVFNIVFNIVLKTQNLKYGF